MRRPDICLYLGPADRAELQALLTNRNTARKLAWRAGIVLATAEGEGTVEIMRRTGMSNVNGGAKTGHVAAQNQASRGVPSAMARALVT